MVRGGLGREGKGRGARQTADRLIHPKHCNSQSQEYRQGKECRKRRRNGAGAERFLRQEGGQEEER